MQQVLLSHLLCECVMYITHIAWFLVVNQGDSLLAVAHPLLPLRLHLVHHRVVARQIFGLDAMYSHGILECRFTCCCRFNPEHRL